LSIECGVFGNLPVVFDIFADTMITYNPKDWIKLIFAFHRSDTFRILFPAMIGLAIFSFGVAYVEREYWIPTHPTFKTSALLHQILGFVISLLLVFRTNTAYDRWWEGRRAWGTFINHARSFAMKMATYIPKEYIAERDRLRILTSSYFFAVKDHLRGQVNPDEWEMADSPDAETFAGKEHVPNAILLRITEEVVNLNRKNIISDSEMRTVTDELRSFADNLGACERIRNTPIPYSYSIFIKKIIFLYTFTLPFGFAGDFGYWTILVACLVFYAFASLELIAEEIEDPFGFDPNDLPTEEFCKKIRSNVNEIFQS
jgi:ion channel-forming bestrophin family protein